MKTYRHGQTINNGDVVTTPDGPAVVVGYSSKTDKVALSPIVFVPAQSMALRDGGLVVLTDAEVEKLEAAKVEAVKTSEARASIGTTLE